MQCCAPKARAPASMSCSSPAARRTGWRRARASPKAPAPQIIDINMGCPAKHVANRQSGSALMRDLDHALSLIEATVGAVKVPVTLKMRLGWDDRSHQRAGACAARGGGRRPHDHRAWPHALPVLQRHGRLGRGARGQGRASRSRSSSTATSAASTTPTRRSRASGADAVMVGRAAQGRPWFPGQIARYLETGRRETRAAARHAVCADRRALRGDARASRPAHRPATCAQASRLGARRRGRDRRRRRSTRSSAGAQRADQRRARRGAPPARRRPMTPSPARAAA